MMRKKVMARGVSAVLILVMTMTVLTGCRVCQRSGRSQ